MYASNRTEKERSQAEYVPRKKKHFHYQFKILMLGDVGTGKSCMRLQFVEKRLPEVYQKTRYIAYAAKTLEINAKRIKLEIWDYGEEAQRDLSKETESRSPNCIGVVLVFSITSKESYQHICNWLSQQKMHYHPYVRLFLVGTKADQYPSRQVTAYEAQQLAFQNQMNYFEISTKDYQQVSDVFKHIALDIYEMVERKEFPMKYLEYGVRQLDNQLGHFTLVPTPRVHKARCC